VLQPLLPVARRPGRPPRWTRRQLIDAIRWRIRVGAPWRDVPACYGSWSAAYALFRRWQRDGTSAGIMTALQTLADAAGRITLGRVCGLDNRPSASACRWRPEKGERGQSRCRSCRLLGTAETAHAVRYEAVVHIAAINEWL
jgi:transposase